MQDITSTDLATHLRISQYEVRARIKAGKIAGTKLPGPMPRWTITAKEAIRLITEAKLPIPKELQGP